MNSYQYLILRISQRSKFSQCKPILSKSFLSANLITFRMVRSGILSSAVPGFNPITKRGFLPLVPNTYWQVVSLSVLYCVILYSIIFLTHKFTNSFSHFPLFFSIYFFIFTFWFIFFPPDAFFQ